METLLKKSVFLGLDPWEDAFAEIIRERRAFLDQEIGNYGRYKRVVDRLPDITPSQILLDRDHVTIGTPDDISEPVKNELNSCLEALCPWRKGPFDFFGIEVDSEWRSCLKWNRIESHLPSLKDAKVLDIGSSNGYYMFRSAMFNPKMVLGVEPQSAFYYQYLALQKYLRLDNVHCLPIPHDRLPAMENYFDAVFCMGILYHRKNPVEMLKSIYDSLCPGGVLVLENLIIEGKNDLCLFPKDRYAKMRNVFFIPDISAMESWLGRAGFSHISCVDLSRTTCSEQRKTRWIQTESLEDFLDPDNPDKTVEGYPAPVRAVFIARR